MEAVEVTAALKARGYSFFAGVPDSTFGSLFSEMEKDPDIRYTRAVREDTALGVASAAHLSGGRGGIVLQNSGLGNLVNPLTSFSLMYGIPVLFIIGWRGYGGPPNDAPEHWIMGEKTEDFLKLMGMPYRLLKEDNLESALDGLIAEMDQRSIPGALLVRGGIVS